METTPVTLDGTALGTLTTGSGLLNSVVLVDGIYHMWVMKSGDGAYISKFIHATSEDGIRFSSKGTLNVPESYWATYTCAGVTPATEPFADRLRVSKVGDDWIMMVWHRNQTGHNYYSYSTSVWNIGPDPSNLNVNLIGPVPSQACDSNNQHPGRNHVGVFGMTDVDGEDPRIWLRDDHNSTTVGLTGGALAGYEIDMDSPPLTSDTPRYGAAGNTTYEFDLLAGTGYYEYPIDTDSSMVMPIGRTLDQGRTLGTYFAIVNRASQAPVDKELWYTESADGGETWSASAPIYGSGVGQNVLVDGLPNKYGFRAPEVVEGGVRTYFWTRDFCDNRVMVTAIDEASKPKLTIVKDFAAEAVDVGGTTNLTVTVTAPELCRNSKGEVPTEKFVHNVTYTDTLPINGGGQIALTGTVVSNPCGKLTISDDKRSFTLAEVDLAMNESCSVQVEVQGNVAGFYENVIPAAEVTNTEGLLTADDARDTLRVGAVPPATVTPVPTTGPLSLAALAGLLGFFAVRRNRKSKKE